MSDAWFVVKKSVAKGYGFRFCGHRHTSERELALCWRKRGEIWEVSEGGPVKPVTEAAQLARIRALVPRPDRGRPPSESPRIREPSPIHVRGVSKADKEAYRRVAEVRGYASLSDFVRALLDAEVQRFEMVGPVPRDVTG